jgi:HlyD family secretion protein
MNKQKRILIVAAVALLGVAGFFGVRAWRGDDAGNLSASGTVEATEAQLGFQAPGRIETIKPREGDSVKRVELLAQLDAREARRDLARNKTLVEGGAIGQEAYDKTVLALRVAESDDAQAAAQVAVLAATLANMTVRAPFDGTVTVRHHEPGEVVGAGAPVLTLMDPNDRWVRIYIPENHIGAVRLAQKASVTTDTYPDKRYGGEVVFIASQAEFTPKNVQTAEERVKLVYAVKVRITDDPRFELKPGVPADVRLEAAHP